MATLTPTPVADGNAATSATLNANVAELEKLNGDIGAINLKSGMLLTKDKIRPGAMSRHAFASALISQLMDVSAPGADVDLVTGEEIFVAGQTARLTLPPGSWAVLVSVTPQNTYNRISYRVDRGAWSDLTFMTGYMAGTILIVYPTSTDYREIEYAVKYVASGSALSLGAVTLFALVDLFRGSCINLSAFRNA